MRNWLTLLRPPEWDIFSLVQKAVYAAAFIGGALAVKWLANCAFYLVFGY